MYETVKDILRIYPEVNEIEVYRVDNLEHIRNKMYEDYLRYCDDYNPYELVFDYEVFTPEEYVESAYYIEGSDAPEEDTLVILLDEETGIIPDEEVWGNVENGNISDELIGKVLRQINQTAKWYRDKSCLRHSNYVPERVEGFEVREKMDRLYKIKEYVLTKYSPLCIHHDEKQELYYLYYEIGGYGFHQPLDEAKLKNYNLNIIDIGLMKNECVLDYEDLFCDRFVSFVIKHLIGFGIGVEL